MTFWVAGASLAGGLIAANGAKSAAGTQSDAANQATALQREMWQQQQKNQQPWLDAGTNALTQLNQGTGPGGSLMKPFGMGDYQADPGYAFRLSEGLKGLDRTAAARGGLLSGATLKGAMRFNQDQASNEYGNAYNRYNTNQSNQYNRLASMAGLGQTANTQLGQAGQNYANQAGAGIMAAGQATAAGQLGVGNTMNNALGTMASTYQNQNNFNSYMNRPGGQNYNYMYSDPSQVGPPSYLAGG